MKLLSADSVAIDYTKIRNLGNRIIVPGTLAIADQWMLYHNKDGTERYEYVPENILFDQDSLGTLQGAPLAVQHPGEVTSANYRDLASKGLVVGSISTQLTIDRGRKQLDILAIIHDKPTIDQVLSKGITELSPQYWKQTEPHPEYKSNCFTQTSRDYTGCEVSLVAKARGGKDACLHLGKDSASPPQKYYLSHPQPKLTMASINIDGIDVTIEDSSKQVLEKFLKSTDAATNALTKARDEALSSNAALEADKAALEADKAALEVKNAQLEQDAAAIKAKAEKEQTTRDRQDILVSAIPIFKQATDSFDEANLKGLSNRQIKEGAISLKLPTLEAVKTKSLDSCSDDTIQAYWLAIGSMAPDKAAEPEANQDSSDPLKKILGDIKPLDLSTDAEGEKLENEYRLTLENAWEVK